MTKESLEVKSGLTIEIMTYNSIKSAVPRSWSAMIKNDSMINFKNINPLDVKIEMQYCNLKHQIKNKTFTTISIGCRPGYNGGLKQYFVAILCPYNSFSSKIFKD